jgi:hypothetical protein
MDASSSKPTVRAEGRQQRERVNQDESFPSLPELMGMVTCFSHKAVDVFKVIHHDPLAWNVRRGGNDLARLEKEKGVQAIAHSRKGNQNKEVTRICCAETTLFRRTTT